MTTKTKQRHIVIHTERCKGCGLCIHFCPQLQLELSETQNSRGFLTAMGKSTIHEKCTGCGQCYLVCPDGAIEVIDDSTES